MNKKTITISLMAITIIALLSFSIAGKIIGIDKSIDLKSKFNLTEVRAVKLQSKNIDDMVKQDYTTKGEYAFINLYQRNGINDFIKVDRYYDFCLEYKEETIENCTQIEHQENITVCHTEEQPIYTEEIELVCTPVYEEIRLDEKDNETKYTLTEYCENRTNVITTYEEIEVCNQELNITYETVCNPYNQTTTECKTSEVREYTSTELKDMLNEKVKERLELIADVDRNTLTKQI